MYLESPALTGSVIPYMEEKENIGQVASYQIPIVAARTDSAGQLESVRAQLQGGNRQERPDSPHRRRYPR